MGSLFVYGADVFRVRVFIVILRIVVGLVGELLWGEGAGWVGVDVEWVEKVRWFLDLFGFLVVELGLLLFGL